MGWSRLRIVTTAAFVVAGLLPAAAQAQAPRTARVQVTVVDPSSAVVPDATVDLVGLEQATQAAAVPSGKTSASGVAILEGVARVRIARHKVGEGAALRGEALLAGDERLLGRVARVGVPWGRR